jgi:hypothetical protein
MPKRNFGSSFLGGFSQTFNPTFQNVLDNLMQEERQRKIMEEQNRREAEEEKKRQQGRNAVMDLFRGGETTPTQNWFRDNIPFVNQDKSQFTPYTQEQQIEKIGQIFPEPSQYYNAVSELLKPKQQKTVKIGGSVFKESPYYENVPEGEALYTEPKRDIREEIIPANEIKGQEKFTGYVQKVKREYDEEGNIVSQQLINQPYRPTEKKTDGNGNDYTKLTDPAFKEYDKKWKEYQNALSLKTALEKGGKPYYISNIGEIKFYDKKMVEDMVQTKRGQLQDYVERNKSPEATDYINTNWDSVAVDDINQVPEAVWNVTWEDYISGEIEPSVYQELLYQYRSEYGFDPLVKYAR